MWAAQVQLIDAVTLPSKKGHFLQAEVRGSLGTRDTLFEPQHEVLESLGLCAQEALISVQPDGTVLIPMHNYHGTSVSIDAGTPLGTVRPISVDEVVPVEECIVTADDVGPALNVDMSLSQSGDSQPDELLDTDTAESTAQTTPPSAERIRKIQEMLNLPEMMLTEEEQAQLTELIVEFNDIFALDDAELGCCNLVQHTIDTGDHRPILIVHPLCVERK